MSFFHLRYSQQPLQSFCDLKAYKARLFQLEQQLGKLVFLLDNDLTKIIDLQVQLLVNGNNASTDDYKNDGLTANSITIDVLGHIYVGEKTYSLGFAAPGYISSDTVNSATGSSILTYSATKLGQVDSSTFKKNGAYIEWQHLDHATHYELSFVQAGGDNS